MSRTEASAEPAASPARSRWRLRYDHRFTPPLFITLILLVGHLSFGILEGYGQIVLAIGAAIVAELVLSRLFRGQWPHLASAYITGISVGILVRTPYFWPFALCSVLSIMSKYVLHVKGQHLWNPSNFGICAMLFLAPWAVAGLSIQWGNHVWPMVVIWILGSVIIWKLRRFHICAVYVAGFILFTWVRTLYTGHSFWAELAPITGPMYQLFIFFMITDPKTTVKSRGGQCLVAFLVAFAEMILRLNESVHAPYYALFLVGPAANLVSLWWGSRTARDPAGPARRTERRSASTVGKGAT